MIKRSLIKRKRKSWTSFGLLLLIFGFIFSVAAGCWAYDAPNVNTTVPQTLSLTVGKSIIVESQSPVRRVSLAEPEIADAVVLSPQQVYVTGKASGITTLTLWSSPTKISRIFDLDVMPDISRLREKLHEMFPQEENIRVTATHDSLTLAGTVSSAPRLAEIMAVARSYAPKGKDGSQGINNLLEAGGVHQVMLEVRISEMSRSVAKKMGVNFNIVSASGRQFGVSVLDNLSTVDSLYGFALLQPLGRGGQVVSSVSTSEAFPVKPLGISSSVNAIFRFICDEEP